jgi:hypothetical protein
MKSLLGGKWGSKNRKVAVTKEDIRWDEEGRIVNWRAVVKAVEQGVGFFVCLFGCLCIVQL